MTDKELLQQALNALELCDPIRVEKEVEALRARLAQPEPEQDGECQHCDGRGCSACHAAYLVDINAQREWVGLTDEDIEDAGRLNVEGARMLPYSFARAIEAKLKEKNGF